MANLCQIMANNDKIMATKRVVADEFPHTHTQSVTNCDPNYGKCMGNYSNLWQIYDKLWQIYVKLWQIMAKLQQNYDKFMANL